MVKIQKNSQGKHWVYLPDNVLESRGWGKGTDVALVPTGNNLKLVELKKKAEKRVKNATKRPI